MVVIYSINMIFTNEGDKMENVRKFYGDTMIDRNDYNELDMEYKIELQYYKTQGNILESDKAQSYGIEIVKKEFSGSKTNIESREFFNIVDTEEKVDKILEILKVNKVTPVCVCDVLEDLMKESIYNKLR